MNKTMKDVIKENPQLNLDNFGDIINRFLTEIDYRMVIRMPEGTQDVSIKDNANSGPVVWLYALIAGLVPVLTKLTGTILDKGKVGEMLDGMLRMVKKDVLEGLRENGSI